MRALFIIMLIVILILFARCSDSLDPVSEPSSGSSTSSASNTVITPETSPYFPDWGQPVATSQTTLHLDYDSSQNALQNGDRLRAAIDNLQPGSELVVGAGNYELDTSLDIDVEAFANAPVVIKGASGTRPHLRALNNAIPAIAFGANRSTQFVYFAGFEISGGSIGLAIGAATDLWLDQLEIHDTTNAGLRNTQADKRGLYFTRSFVHNTGAEGVRLWRLHDSMIALNEVTDTTFDAIAITEDCYNVHVARNYIHHLKDNPTLDYPGIRIWHGPLTDEQPVNIIEKNVVHDILDNCIQLEGGQARVSNNLVFNCKNKGIDATHGTTFQEIPSGSGNWHGVSSVVNRVYILNNTVFNLQYGNGIGLGSWVGTSIGQDRLYCINNAVYMRPPTPGTSPFSILFSGAIAASGGEVHDNVVFGSPVLNTPSGYSWTAAINGNSLADFTNINSAYVVTSRDSFINDARPTNSSALNANGDGFGSAFFNPADDLSDSTRSDPREVGALDTL